VEDVDPGLLLDRRPLDLAAVGRRAADSFRRPFRDKGVGLEVELEPAPAAARLGSAPRGVRPQRPLSPSEVGRPAGIKPGTALDFPVAINSGPLPLEPGLYEWRLSINGEGDEDWRLAFSVRAEEDTA